MERDAEGGEEVVVSMGEDKSILAELVDLLTSIRCKIGKEIVRFQKANSAIGVYLLISTSVSDYSNDVIFLFAQMRDRTVCATLIMLSRWLRLKIERNSW